MNFKNSSIIYILALNETKLDPLYSKELLALPPASAS